jgi:predicted metal-dependent hydrolase
MTARPGTILQGGRAKAYRPMPAADRRKAFEKGVAAYERGDYFEAHELLEPAWMGSADLPERNLLQGLIKLAAAYVHGVRGNPLGIARNLAGARDRLDAAAGSPAAAASGIDVAALVAAIDDRLARVARDPDDETLDAPPLPRIS